MQWLRWCAPALNCRVLHASGILAELMLTVLGKVRLHARDNLARRHGDGHSSIRRKGIEPKNAKNDQLDEHSIWDLLEWECGIGGSNALLHGADPAFNMGNMLIPGYDIHVDAKDSGTAAE